MNLCNTAVDIICRGLIFIGISLFFYVLWLGFYKRKEKDKKEFYDFSGVKPSDSYLKTVKKFIKLFDNIKTKIEIGDKITQKEIQSVEILYNKVFIKEVEVIPFYTQRLSKGSADKWIKYFKSQCEAWKKYDNAVEI